jgi:hypothetical protein
LQSLAEDWFGDYSYWREIADLAGIDDPLSQLPIGEYLNKPIKELAEEKYNQLIDSTLGNLTAEVQTTVQNIINSTEAQTIARILGVDLAKVQESLDLSSISDQISAEAWQLISWVL